MSVMWYLGKASVNEREREGETKRGRERERRKICHICVQYKDAV